MTRKRQSKILHGASRQIGWIISKAILR